MNNPNATPTGTPPSPTGSADMVDLGEVLDISSISPFRQTLEQVLGAKQTRLVLSGEHVTRIDGAALQLLASFFREANTLGCEVQWKEPSPALQRAAQLLGLSRSIGLHDAGVQ